MMHAFLAANRVNTAAVNTPGARLGIVAAGKAYQDLRQALCDLGLADPDSDTALRRAGIRLLRLGVIHPVGRGAVREFAAGLETVLVIEEKIPFVEAGVRDALYGLPGAPAVIGSQDKDGRPLVPVAGELTAGALFSHCSCSWYRAAAAAISDSRELGLYLRTRCRYS